MSGSGARLLIATAGRDPAWREAAAIARKLGARVTISEGVAATIDHVRRHGADLVLADVGLAIGKLVEGMGRERLALPILACGISATAEQAVRAIRAGAFDYIPLPPDPEMIAAAIHVAGEQRHQLVGDDPRWLRELAVARGLAKGWAPILIEGEPGSGRSIVVRDLHARSARSGPLVAFEAMGRDVALLESELFGHRAGDFPGARADRAGRLVEARGGSLLIRHLDQLDPRLQRRLAEALSPMPPVRIFATVGLRAGERIDPLLARRLGDTCVSLPALRERRGDIGLLAEHFIALFAGQEGLAQPSLSRSARARLEAHDWPGNARELEHMMHRAVLLAGGSRIMPDMLLNARGRPLAPEAADGGDGDVIRRLVGQSVEAVERGLILETLERCGGNRTSASNILGISVRTMRNKLRQFLEQGFEVSPAP